MREVEKVYSDNYNILSKFKNDSKILQSHLQKILGLRDDVLVPNYNFELNDNMITSYAKEYADENCLVLNDDIEPIFHFMVRKELAISKFETLKDAVYYTLKKLERGYIQKDIIKLACKELNRSESELSEELNVNTFEFNKWKEKGYPEFLEKVLTLLIENKKLKETI
jgi:hypothetical protein|tara:strand:- start:7042 stop:7545 length:504 start_codon:yes stop_codon:yes gene_type:complete